MMKYPAAKLFFTFPQKGKQALGVFRLITKVLLLILLKQMHLAAFLCVWLKAMLTQITHIFLSL